MAELILEGLRKSYGQTEVIHGVDLRIESGQFAVFVGPSGCGKSTLLRMIAGLESVTAGDVRLNGQRMNEVPAAQRDLAMGFQSYALYPHMTVRQNLSFGLENFRMPRAKIRQRVEATAAMLQIDPYLNRRPGQLSGGQRQRVAIGRALVREPAVYLFDEPLSNLDAELRVAMRVEIKALHSRLGNTMVYVTHDQVEAMTMADLIVVLRAGRIEQAGTPLTLYNRPANRFVAGFIGSPRMNFIQPDAELLTAVKRAEPGLEAALGGKSPTLGIRPEHLLLGAQEGAVQLAARITMSEQLGADSFLYGRLTDGQAITVRAAGQVALRKDETVTLTLPRDKLHLFAGEDDAAEAILAD